MIQEDLSDVTTFSGPKGFALPELAGSIAQQAVEDMALVARGEELDIPWRRLRILIDYELVEITTQALLGGSLRGSRTTISWTDEGTRFMSRPILV